MKFPELIGLFELIYHIGWIGLFAATGVNLISGYQNFKATKKSRELIEELGQMRKIMEQQKGQGKKSDENG